MTDSTIQEAPPAGVPAPPPPPPDDENPAMLDALKTFQIALACAFLFCGASLVIILMTRLG